MPGFNNPDSQLKYYIHKTFTGWTGAERTTPSWGWALCERRRNYIGTYTACRCYGMFNTHAEAWAALEGQVS